MATRKQADEADNTKAEDAGAEDQAADGAISLTTEEGAESEAKLEEGDLREDGSVVGEEVASNGVDRLVPVKTETPTPGGPGDRDVLSKDDKAEAAALVVNAEVTSQNPEPYSEAELNHRFSHVPPADWQNPPITIQQ